MKYYKRTNDGYELAGPDDALDSLWDIDNRRIDHLEKDGVMVSTVFLVIDHSFNGGNPPILYETMVFGGEHDQDQSRYATEAEAREGHKEMCKKVFGEIISYEKHFKPFERFPQEGEA